MWTRRFTYVVALAGSVLFHALYPFWISRYLMVLVILLIPFDLIVSMPGMLTKRVSLFAPNVLDQDAEGIIIVTTYQKRPFPSGRIKAGLRIITDDYSTRRRIICDPEAGSRYTLAIDTSHSGLAVFAVRRIRTTSLIGLFSLLININSAINVLILPAPVKPPHIAPLPRGGFLRPKPGGGFSEDHDLRPYRSGDPVRAIHWKVSAKYDSLVIREPLVLPPHSRLVRVAQWSGAQERDTVLGRLRWISDYLLKRELPFFVKLGDDGAIAEITRADDLLEYLYHILSDAGSAVPSGALRPAQAPARFSWVFLIDAKEETAS